jgi:hypothetical protein
LEPVSETVTAMQKRKPGPKPKKIEKDELRQKEHQNARCATGGE